MKSLVILCIGIALVSTWLGAQEGSFPPTPSETVTALIREALRSPDGQGNWTSLADGLSAMGSSAPEGAAGFSAAIRIADSLALSSEVATGSTDFTDVSWWIGLVGQAVGQVRELAAWRSAEGDSLANFLAFPFLLCMAIWVWFLLRGPRRNRKTSRLAREGMGKADDGDATRAMALSLADYGMPANEVARQTGLAQDTLAVLLAIQGQGGPFADREPVPVRRSA